MKLSLKRPLSWLAVLIFISAVGVQWANAQSVTVNWMNWNAPTSYPSTNSSPFFNYASGATGQLTLPNGTVVTVTMTGEVIQRSCFSSDSCSSFDWLSVEGTTAPYTSANVPSLPPTNDMIAQTGYVDPAHTLTFSQNVSNVVMNIFSLGGFQKSEYTFDQEFEILSQDPRCNPNNAIQYCLSKDPNNSKTLIGYEGNGTIQFTGTYSSITWTVSVPEFYSGFNIGVSSAGSEPPPPPPPPGPPCSVVDGRTLTETQWNSKGSFNPLSQHWFGEKFPSGLIVGKGSRKVTLTSDVAVRDFLPAGPKSAILLSEWTNPGKRLRNSLAGQLVAAKLNLALSPGLTKAVVPHSFGGGFAGMSFKQIIDAADAALGWDGTGTMPTQAELNAFNDILSHINKSYSTGNHRGFLVCVDPE